MVDELAYRAVSAAAIGYDRGAREHERVRI
jgi:hypothetical protein